MARTMAGIGYESIELLVIDGLLLPPSAAVNSLVVSSVQITCHRHVQSWQKQPSASQA